MCKKIAKINFLKFSPVFTAIQGIIDATTDQLNEIEKECTERHKVSHLHYKFYTLISHQFHIY
jgi:hypothetical protein